MDINLAAILVICGLYGVWRLHDIFQQRSRSALIRERVAWMLWLAANKVRTS